MLTLHHIHHLDPALERWLHRVSHALITNQETIMATLDELKVNVEKNTEVDQSAMALLENLKKALDDAIAAGSMDQVKALSDQLGASNEALAAAVAANTPGVPTASAPVAA